MVWMTFMWGERVNEKERRNAHLAHVPQADPGDLFFLVRHLERLRYDSLLLDGG
jgi:hypothetical protein